MKRLKNKKPEDWKLHFINYDNMCNVARLRLLQGRLALPEPFPTIFLDVDKVIDDLHIKSQLETLPEAQRTQGIDSFNLSYLSS